MTDYGRQLEFGISVVPNAADLTLLRELAVQADAAGLEWLGIQDHPYQWRYVETWLLLADLAVRTERIRLFPDVANLPLRLPALIAKQGATLDVLSGGRFELGLGAGSFWEAIAAMGGPSRNGREALEALEEAIGIIRACWSGERTVRFEGHYYTVSGLHPGPAPVHPIGIWVGGYKSRTLDLVGRLGDGWVPSLPYAPPAVIPELQQRVDAGAAAAGRDPAAVRRVYNLMGRIGDGEASESLQGPVSYWVEMLSSFVLELGFDTLVFWPGGDDQARQVRLFADEVVPPVRAEVARARGTRPGG